MTVLTSVAVLLVLAASVLAVRNETFDAGLGPWVEHDIGGNIPTPCWSSSNNAEGVSGPGELGGTFTRQEASDYPYIADATLFPVDHIMPLTLKVKYKPIDIKDGDRDPHITLGYIDTATRRHSIFWLQLTRWSDQSNKSGKVYAGGAAVAWWTVKDNTACVVDLMYYYNGKEAVVKGTVYGTADGTLVVDAKAPVSEATADAFGLMIQAGSPEEHTGRQVRLYLDDMTYGGPEAENARRPSPAYFAEDVPRDVVLSWLPGDGATEHDVYFGVDEFSVSNATTASPEYKGRQSGTSYDPEGPIPGVEDLVSGATYYWRVDEVAGSTVTKGFVWSFTTTTSARAQDPSPSSGTEDIGRDVVLGWVSGVGAQSHDVYFGQNKALVTIADTTRAEYRGNQTNTSYDPPEKLDLGRTYYWRVDEVDPYTTHKGDVWEFTMATGKASDPAPGDGQVATADAVLGWQTGAGSVVSHEVYLGTDYDSVLNATKASPQYVGNETEPIFDPGALAEATRYYWRVDEVGDSDVLPALLGPDGAVKGPVWSFVTPGYYLLQVDLASPHRGQPGDPSLVQYRADTAKEGWTIWADQRWWDLYMHDWVVYSNIGKTGINAALSTAYDGEGGLKVSGMCMQNKAGGDDTIGYPLHDPIANSWYYQVDHVNPPSASIVLALANLPPGEYWVTSYHNYWQPQSSAKRECTPAAGQGAEHPMPWVKAMSFQEAFDYYACVDNGSGCGANHSVVRSMAGYTGADSETTGITSLEEAANVVCTSTTNDNEVGTSLIKFITDGSPLVIAYEAATWQSESQYIGGRAVLNAFEIQAQSPVLAAGRPNPADGAADVELSAKLSWTPGGLAVWHEVYFGADQAAVADGTAAKVTLSRGTETLEQPFVLGRSYYWRVDEVGAKGTVWPGEVWSLSTAECATIDDFEGDLAWEATGGAWVEPSTEQKRNGSASMQLQYYNRSPNESSGGAITFDDARNFNGFEGFGFYYKGEAGNQDDKLYAVIEDASGNSSMVVSSANLNLSDTQWQLWSAEFTGFTGADLGNVTKIELGAGTPGGSSSGAIGNLYIDDVGLCGGGGPVGCPGRCGNTASGRQPVCCGGR